MTASASPQNLSEMQILSPYPRSLESETRRVNLFINSLTHPSGNSNAYQNLKNTDLNHEIPYSWGKYEGALYILLRQDHQVPLLGDRNNLKKIITYYLLCNSKEGRNHILIGFIYISINKTQKSGYVRN